MTDSSDRTRRIRSLIEFQAKVAGTSTQQSGGFLTAAIYGAALSKEIGCCEPPPTNYGAYFTVTEAGRAVASAFNIPAAGAFTIEWWQTDVSANAFQSRHIFSFGTQSQNNVEFACLFTQGSIVTIIDNIAYPEFPISINYGSFESMLTPNHFALARAAGAGSTVRVYKNGEFLGEFAYDGPISITNANDTKMTIRNQTTACQLAQMYGELPSFRWTAANLYNGTIYEPVGNFAPPAMPLAPQAQNVITINNFPTSGSALASGMIVTRYDAAGLPTC